MAIAAIGNVHESKLSRVDAHFPIIGLQNRDDERMHACFAATEEMRLTRWRDQRRERDDIAVLPQSAATQQVQS